MSNAVLNCTIKAGLNIVADAEISRLSLDFNKIHSVQSASIEIITEINPAKEK